MNALLQPITQHHPFELTIGDYLALPTGKGGYHTVGLYLNTCSQHIWGEKFKTAGSAKMTVKTLTNIFQMFTPAETFMADGGKHFNNDNVKDLCRKWGMKHHTVAPYSPWINGLVEGTNKLLLYVLAQLCAPEIGEDGWQAMEWDKLSCTWLDHFDQAIQVLNWCILPALKFSQKEILLGLIVNTTKTPLESSITLAAPSDINIHMAYTAQQHLDGYAEAIHHALKCKAAFDKQVLKEGGEMIFEKGELVQMYWNDLAKTLSTDHKLYPMWSEPRHITNCILNSYRLATLDGQLIRGEFNTRHLRTFTPQEGTDLARRQETFLAELEVHGPDVNIPLETATDSRNDPSGAQNGTEWQDKEERGEDLENDSWRWYR